MIVITVTGPSGSGKDSITDGMLYAIGAKPYEELTPFVAEHAEALKALNRPRFAPDSLAELVSHTTRAPRVGEVDGKDYYFITKEEFDALPKVEETCYSGNYYCLSQSAVDNCKAKVGIVIVDIEGKEAVEEHVGTVNNASIFIKVDPSVIKDRMVKRGDAPESVEKRLQNAVATKEFENGPKCKFIIENDDYIEAVKKALDILDLCL